MRVLPFGSTSPRSALFVLLTAALLLGALVATATAQSAGGPSDRSATGQHVIRHQYGIAKQRALKPHHRRHKSRRTKARGDVLFSGTHLRDFPVRQSAPGAMTEVPDPAGSGENVFKMVVSDNDGYPVTPTENPRAEVLSPSTIVSGDEIWWSAKFFLPADFPTTSNFVTLLQGPYGPPWNGTPPFHIEANGGVLKWQRNATYDWDIPWQMPLVRNQWVSFMIHERFGSDGFVEMWVNGQPTTFFAGGTVNPNHVGPTQHLGMETMDSSNSGSPNSIYLQSYRKKGMLASLTVYQGPLTIGTTRASVGG